jgi:thioesterase domain-containing protein
MSAAPSLDRLRQTLSNATWRETLGKGKGVIVPLNDQGARMPFFCVHSLTGKATDYVGLAQQLGPDQPFFSVQIPPANRTADFGGVLNPVSIQTVAAHYVEALLQAHPDRPFALGGWSIGAIIALEMAEQLRERGRDVPLLVIFDMITWNPVFAPGSAAIRALDTAVHFPAWLAAHKLVKNGLQPGALARRAGLKLRTVAQKLTGRAPPPPPEVIGDLVEVANYDPGHTALMETLFASAQGYVPQRYDGAVQVYAAKSEVSLIHRTNMGWGWRHIAPRARLRAVSSTHRELFSGPGGAALARHLGARLAALSPPA